MKQSLPISLPRVHDWLSSVAARTRGFSVAGASIAAGRGVAEWDEIVTIRPHGSSLPLMLLVDSKRRLYPQHALAAASRVRRESQHQGPDTMAVLAAPYISDRVAQICRESGVGYIDGAGNCHLEAPGLYVHIEGQQNQSPDTRPAENLFAPKSSRIVRTLLESPLRTWKVQDLAREARVSIGLASRLKHKLIAQAFAEQTPLGLRIRQPRQLLAAWTQAYSIPARAVPVYGMIGTHALEQAVADWCVRHEVRCALAEFSAAARWSPMVRYTRAAIYVEAQRSHDVLEPLMRDLDLKEVDSGPSAELWITDDEAIFFNSEERQGVRVVSPLQAYLDLVGNPSRGQEAATELLRRHLLPGFGQPEESSA